MLQLSQLDLQFAFAGPGALGKDVENQRGAIEHLTLKNCLQVAALRRRKVIIEDDGIDFGTTTFSSKFVCLAAADESAGHRRFQFLGSVADDLTARSGGQFAKFIEGILQIPGRTGLEVQTN